MSEQHVLIRAQKRNTLGETKMHTFNRVENPAAVFSRDTGTLHKIGEAADMKDYFNVVVNAYQQHGFTEMADHITYMDLPKDQEEIDRVFQCTGYIKRLYERTIGEPSQA